MRNKVVFYLNGKRIEAGADKGSMMLAEYLRYDQNLTGTKIVCAEGDCGACSVLRYFPHIQYGVDVQNFVPINSCIMMVAQLDGASIVTIEALKKDKILHETQQAMVSCHGSQCGFCTPGFVIAMTGLVEEKIAKKQCQISEQEAKNCMTGNLCRCTGYRPILDAAIGIKLEECESIKKRYISSNQLSDLDKVYKEAVLIESSEFSFYAPKTIKEALEYLSKHPETRLIGAATDLGVIHNKRKIQLQRLLSLHLVEDLYRIQKDGEEISLGARVSISEFRHFIKDWIPELAKYIDVFASPQIKNVATVIGNIANASPIGDTPPALLALEAKVIVASLKGERIVPLDQFFLAYRKINIHPGEILVAIKFEVPHENSDLRLYKNSNRKDLDISAVNFALKIDWKDRNSKEISKVVIAAGGVAATPLRLKKTEQFLQTNKLSSAALELAIKQMQLEFNPISDVRASSSYRRVLIENYLRDAMAELGGIQ